MIIPPVIPLAPIHEACLAGDLGNVKRLITANATLLEARTEEVIIHESYFTWFEAGSTPLILAAGSGRSFQSCGKTSLAGLFLLASLNTISCLKSLDSLVDGY
jgi:hypothetical protein